MRTFERLLNPFEAAAHSGMFGGGSGGGQQALLQAVMMAQQQQALRDSQGQQMALLAKKQGESDMETASMNQRGLGRALLGYQGARARTLGGE